MTLKRFIDARYSGQVYEIETPVPSAETLTADHLAAIVSAFEDAHEVLYHYRMEGYPAEFVSCRMEAVGRVDAVMPEELPMPPGRTPPRRRRPPVSPTCRTKAGSRRSRPLTARRLEPGNRIAGTAIIETEGSTLVVWKDQQLTVNRYGDFEIDINIDV